MKLGSETGLPVRRIDLGGTDHLLAQHLSAALARFGSAALGVIDLPPIEQATPSKAELQAAAVIGWAREVEATGLLDVVDAIARGVATGALAIEVEQAAIRRLVQHHRDRDERFTAEERAALYERVFGDLDGPLEAYIAALCEVGRASAHRATTHLETRATLAAAALASELSARAVGIVAYAARDITEQIRNALALLGNPSIASALGGGGVWAIARRYGELTGRAAGDPGRAVQRAGAIRTLIAWLAEHASALSGGRVQIGRTDPVVVAALAWSAEGA